ncbi:MAG: MFS transporter [Pseudomonadota bacterium]
MWYVVEGALRGEGSRDVARRFGIVALVSFLTLVDLFGSQALLPQIIDAYATEPGLAGIAVNAATLGMAIAGLTVAWFADRIDRKRGIWICLALLSIPTTLLAFTDSIWIFLGLRVLQGMFMAAAFTLTMTYLSEQCDIMAVGGAMAAYITGNVASNLFGRLLAVSASDLFGLSGSFLVFAGLNLIGAALAFALIGPRDTEPPVRKGSPLEAWRTHWADPALRAAFAVGFLILFVFVGVFTYVNLHLVDMLGVPAGYLGLVYLVFIPALFTTPSAGGVAKRLGPRRALIMALAIGLVSTLLTLFPSLPLILAALAVIGAAMFFAQAAATGFVSQRVTRDQAAANGLYLTSYYSGGLVGAFVLGQVQAIAGWTGVVIGLSVALGLSLLVARHLSLDD